ncbi:MAG: leucine-rich repeat domain-containing protein [Candidatus Onthomorpha sp.]|nr:leucine-rich repeat domain-containing protein [Candidatus Onthomorpha sp.]
MKIQNFGKPLSRLIIMVAICMLSLHAMAYNFSYTHQGKTLYYNITSDNTVEVTYYSSDNYFQNNNYVSGDVVIPSSVTNNGTTYSVTSIGNYAFYECSSLTSVTIGNSVASIGNDAFWRCSGLTSVTIPNSVTSIGEGAFLECSGLTSVTIPNSVTSIGDYAFYGCSGLTSVTIPNSVTSIGNYAFYKCSSLTSIVSNAVVPPAIGNEVFPYPNTCNVTVSCGSLEAYTSSRWNNYFPNRIEEDCSSALQEVESTR